MCRLFQVGTPLFWKNTKVTISTKNNKASAQVSFYLNSDDLSSHAACAHAMQSSAQASTLQPSVSVTVNSAPSAIMDSAPVQPSTRPEQLEAPPAVHAAARSEALPEASVGEDLMQDATGTLSRVGEPGASAPPRSDGQTQGILPPQTAPKQDQQFLNNCRRS